MASCALRFGRNWVFSNSVRCSWDLVRESTVKPVGKPDAGNPHVRFDERGWETGRRFASVLAPILGSTGGSPEWSPLRIGPPCLRNLPGRPTPVTTNRNNLRLIYLLSILLAAVPLAAQTASLRGQVTDE